ncbi:protein-L-isoaspartate(D-aspartate) O-methyltransferase [bacterium]|nr:protein-L-isoaspartate(D-aspartate) O-methyltransferase [bacterium]
MPAFGRIPGGVTFSLVLPLRSGTLAPRRLGRWNLRRRQGVSRRPPLGLSRPFDCGQPSPRGRRRIAGRASAQTWCTTTLPRAAFRRQRADRHEEVPGTAVPENVRAYSYADSPLPIGYEQTISQPYIVALMTAALVLSGTERVLEIGTGSGYQAAVLAEIVPEVYTIEIVEALGKRADETLKRLGYRNVHVRVGDGYRGWPEHAPFDAIMLTAAPEKVPQPLVDQLALGGRLVAPVGSEGGLQWLRRYKKTPKGLTEETLEAVRFVPMTGEAQKRE